MERKKKIKKSFPNELFYKFVTSFRNFHYKKFFYRFGKRKRTRIENYPETSSPQHPHRISDVQGKLKILIYCAQGIIVFQ